MTSALFAVMTATGMYIIMAKLGLFKLFKIKQTRKLTDGGLDVLMTFGLIAIFAGTVSGMMIAMMSGLMLSGMLFLTRYFIKPTKSLGGAYNGINKWIRRVLGSLRSTTGRAKS
jgi:hypothetical protein